MMLLKNLSFFVSKIHNVWHFQPKAIGNLMQRLNSLVIKTSGVDIWTPGSQVPP